MSEDQCGRGRGWSYSSFSCPPPTKFFATSLASFLYGNRLLRLLALKLVRVCNPDASDEMIDEMDAIYSALAAGEYVRLSIYWDMRKQMDIWLNGSNGPEEYRPLCATPMVTGFGASEKSHIARHRLHCLRQTVHLFNRFVCIFFLLFYFHSLIILFSFLITVMFSLSV